MKKNYSFIEEAKRRFGDKYSFPNIENEYKNSHSHITVKCNLCGKTFKKIACDFLTSVNGGCKCEKEREKYISFEDLKDIKTGNEIIPFDGLKHKTKDKIQLVCKKHGIYEKTFKDLSKGDCECQTCARERIGRDKKLSLATFKERMKVLHPTISIVDENEYTKASASIRFRCNNCGYVFKRKPAVFLNTKLRNSCPNCSKEEIRKDRTKTQEEFISDVKNLYGDLYTVIGKYTASSNSITIKCNNCGRNFEIEANSFLQGHGCPYHNFNNSFNENKVYEYVKQFFPDTISNDRKVLNGNELDILIPSKNIAIEYNGLYWHCELKKPKNYHLNKTEECEKKGIRLIHIFEDEWLSKPEIWKSMLNNILGLTNEKIYARKCTIKDVETDEATTFLKKNHIQGWCPSQIKLGLYYNNELVSLMTFGRSRHFIGNGKAEYELLRFCNKINTSVIGGASKLFHYFVKTYDPESIVSYADRRWSVGNLYNKLGFTFVHNSKPNYYYIVGTERKNRFNFRKSILVEKYNCPVDTSEREFCMKQKWYRIYDCGTKVYKWRKNSIFTQT